jgi:metallophosphoesterase (TIGR00282 family)
MNFEKSCNGEKQGEVMTVKRILFVGDVVGKGGRTATLEAVAKWREQEGVSFVIVNGENMAGGSGLTEKCVKELTDAGVDVVTSGDHVWRQKSFVKEVKELPKVLRPANVFAQQPGQGYGVFDAGDGVRIGVMNVLGRVFMNTQADNPFECVNQVVERIKKETPLIVVDFHAEATSEKTAMGRYLDGRVSAVLGTHTHVQTADERVFPKGTAFISDVGMTGARESVLGREIEPVVKNFVTGMPARFAVVEKGVRVHAVLVDVDVKTGKAQSIKRLQYDAADQSVRS